MLYIKIRFLPSKIVHSPHAGIPVAFCQEGRKIRKKCLNLGYKAQQQAEGVLPIAVLPTDRRTDMTDRQTDRPTDRQTNVSYLSLFTG